MNKFTQSLAHYGTALVSSVIKGTATSLKVSPAVAALVSTKAVPISSLTLNSLGLLIAGAALYHLIDFLGENPFPVFGNGNSIVTAGIQPPTMLGGQHSIVTGSPLPTAQMQSDNAQPTGAQPTKV